MSHWLEMSYRKTTGYDLLEQLIDSGHRLGGSESERVAAELTRDCLSDVGARRARLEEFDVTGWERESSVIRSRESDPEEEAFALPRSPSGSGEGPLVNLGYGLPDDFNEYDIDGKVVMVASTVPDHYHRFVHRREKFRMAVDGGATGFIYRNHLDGCHPRSGSVSGSEGSVGEIPAVTVSKEAGLRLARRFEGQLVTVDVDAEITDTISQNVHAELGPETDDRILVTAHVDGHDVSESAADNGGGVAGVVEIAQALASREDELDIRTEFVVYGAEEFGLLGSAHHARTTDLDSIKAVLNHDVLGLTRDLKFITNRFDAFERLAETVCDRLAHPTIIDPRHSLSSDHWRFVERGVPACFVSNDRGSRDRGLILTPQDTLDKIDPRNLREHGVLLTEYVIEMADSEFSPERRSDEELERYLEEEDQRFKANQYRLTAQYM